VPHTLFWGEDEFQSVATMGPAKDVPNVWPKTGLSGFEMDSPWNAFVLGMCKMIAISFTVAGGLRGDYIFPLMCTGATFGRVFDQFTPDYIPVQVYVLCMAAGMNVAITWTCLSSTLILPFLPGEPCAIPPILMASLCSLFPTAYVLPLGYFLRRIFLCYVALDLLFCLFCSRSLRVKLRGVTLITVFFTKSMSSMLGWPCRRMMKSKFLVIQSYTAGCTVSSLVIRFPLTNSY
jgi:hypothetical protein